MQVFIWNTCIRCKYLRQKPAFHASFSATNLHPTQVLPGEKLASDASFPGIFLYFIPGHEDSKMRSWPWWSACTGRAPKPVAWQLHQKVILLYNSCGAGPFFGVPSGRRCVRSTSLRQVDMARLTVGPTVGFCDRRERAFPSRSRACRTHAS